MTPPNVSGASAVPRPAPVPHVWLDQDSVRDLYPEAAPVSYTHLDVYKRQEKYTPEKIENKFIFVLDEIQKTIDAAQKTFSSLIFQDHGERTARSFQVVFLAYYNL